MSTVSLCPDKEVACDGKHGYESYAQATAIARRGAHNRVGTTDAYKCQFCHKWHIGQPSRNRHKKARSVKVKWR